MKAIILTQLILFIILMTSCKNADENNLYKIHKNNVFGYIDSTGQEKIKPQYILASTFKSGLALVVVDTIITKAQYHNFNECKTKLDSFKVNQYNSNIFDSVIYKYGYINASNKFVIDPNLELSERLTDQLKIDLKNGDVDFKDLLFYNRLALFQDKSTKKFGYINKKGEVMIQAKYNDALCFSEGLASVDFAVKKDNFDNTWGYIDTIGKTVIQPKYSRANKFNNGLAIVSLFKASDYSEKSIKKKEQIHFSISNLIINKSGNIIGEPFNGVMEHPIGYSDSMCIVSKNLGSILFGYRFIDFTGKYTTEFELSDVTRFSNGFAGIKGDSGWVFIDKNMNIVSQKYESVLPFQNGLAPVKKNGKWGYINTSFMNVIPNRFDSCGYFNGSLATFMLKSDALVIEGYINKKGDVIWQNEKFEFKKTIASQIDGEINSKGELIKYKKPKKTR